MTMTTTTREPPPALLAAIRHYDDTAYHCRRTLIQYGSETWPYRVALGKRTTAWEAVKGLMVPGTYYRVPGLLGERVLGWSETGELTLTKAP